MLKCILSVSSSRVSSADLNAQLISDSNSMGFRMGWTRVLFCMFVYLVVLASMAISKSWTPVARVFHITLLELGNTSLSC